MTLRQFFILALISLLITAFLAAVAANLFLPDMVRHVAFDEGGNYHPPLWLPILVAIMSSSIAIGILSIFMVRLLRELRAREEMLAKTERERLSFAADAAHELRTPLAIMRANIDGMPDSDPTRQLRGDIERITRTIEQILAKSRIEAIAVKPDEMVDLSALSKEMAAYFAPLVIKEGRSIEVIGADVPTPVNGNAFSLEQALRNLVENALKYSARGSTITLEIVRDARESHLSVIDRGRGVPKEARELIFERFHRADRRGSGSGLGLSIVRRVAEAHGGRVSVEDATEGGAIFTLHVPHKN